MRKIISYLSNILGVLLLLTFSVVIFTENTDIIFNYFKDDIKREFKKSTNLDINFDTLSMKWNGLNPSIIIDNLILNNEKNKLLVSDQLVIKLNLRLPKKNNVFVIEELDLVGSNLSVQYSDDKFLINNYDILSNFNSKSRSYPFDKIKLRLSDSSINLYNLNTNQSYVLKNMNAVVFENSREYSVFTTFNQGNDNQIFHLASKFTVGDNKKLNGSLYLKGVNVDYSHVDLIANRITLSLDNLGFTLWAKMKNSKLEESNGILDFNNAYLSTNANNQLHKINNGSLRFKYNYSKKNKLFSFDRINVNIDNINYKENEVSFILTNNQLHNLKIKTIYVKTAKDLFRTLNTIEDRGMALDDALIDQGLLQDITLTNLQSILNINYKLSYKNIGFKSSDGQYLINGVSGLLVGDGNSGIMQTSTEELSIYKDDEFLLDLDRFSGSVSFKIQPNSIKIYSDNITFNEQQTLNLKGKISNDFYNIRVTTTGDLELLKQQDFFKNNDLTKNLTIDSKYSLEYVLIKNRSKFKNYGVIELDNLTMKHDLKKIFISAKKYKLVLLDKFIFSNENTVTLNKDKYQLKIDSGVDGEDLFYKITASGLLSSENIKSVVNSKLINTLDGESVSTMSLKYTNVENKPSLVGMIKTDMVGFKLNIFSPLEKTKIEEKQLLIKTDFMATTKYFDVSYDVYDMRFSKGDEFFNINIVSPFLNGNIRIPDSVSDENRILARLQYLDLNQFSGIADPKEYLPMKLQIKEIKIYNSFFNNFNVETSSHADGMSIDKISFANKYLSMNGQGKWINNTAGQMTFFDGNFNSINFGKSLDNFGYKDLIKRGKLSSRLIGQWPNSPETFSFKNFDGKILLNLNDGDFLKVTRETKVIGQLLGLFSIASLQKRLSLDFSDFFSSGLSFDQMTGEFIFLDSISTVKSLNINGTFGEMIINGVSDVKKETHDHKLTYIPDLSSMSLISGTLLGGPIGAVASIFYDKVLKQIGIDTNELAAVEYSITGSWSDPEIILLEPFKQIEN